MQADNLELEDVKKLEDVFKEIKKENPEAKFQTFERNKFEKKDCLFKNRCKK